MGERVTVSAHMTPSTRRRAIRPREQWVVMWSITGVLLSVVAGRSGTANACPACKEALFDPAQLPQRLATARGYAVSIGVMLAVPALLIGGVATRIVRSARGAPRTSLWRHPPPHGVGRHPAPPQEQAPPMEPTAQAVARWRGRKGQ